MIKLVQGSRVPKLIIYTPKHRKRQLKDDLVLVMSTCLGLATMTVLLFWWAS